MDTSVIAADFDPIRSARGHSLASGLFAALFILGGLILVVKAFRTCRRHHDPHAASYSRPSH